jgi:nucleoside-diphosphate-sugar epimerase
MKVLVTGGSGFLGSHVAELLSQSGHTVRALVRKSSNRKFLASLNNVEFAEGTVEDAASCDRALDGVDAIIHSAGLVKARNAEEFFATNHTGTTNLLDVAKNHPRTLKRFVLVSSQAAIGPSESGERVTPDREPRPVTNYGRSKLAAERAAIAEAGRLHVVVIRPPLIYGPRDNETLQFFQWVARGVRLAYGDGSNTLSAIYVSDAAAACVRALDANVTSGSAYFVEDGRIHVWREFIGEIERAVGKKTFIRFGIPLSVIKGYAALGDVYSKVTNKAVMVTLDKFNELREKHWVCDGSSTRAELGWEPKVELGDGLDRAARWYREQGWL